MKNIDYVIENFNKKGHEREYIIEEFCPNDYCKELKEFYLLGNYCIGETCSKCWDLEAYKRQEYLVKFNDGITEDIKLSVVDKCEVDTEEIAHDYVKKNYKSQYHLGAFEIISMEGIKNICIEEGVEK